MTTAKRPITLILIDHYLPGYRSGGPARTTANTVEWLGDDICFYILTKDRDYGESVPYPDLQTGMWHQVGKAQVRYLSPQELMLPNLFRILRDTPHDIIYTNSTFSTRTVVVLIFARLGLVRKPIILAPRGSLSAGALGLKSAKKRLYLALARLFGLYERIHWHSTSDDEIRDIRSIFGTQNKLSITHIPNLPTPISDRITRTRIKQSGSARIVMLSRISRMKNLEFVAEALNGVQGVVILDFWGPIEDQAYWESCLHKFGKLPANITIRHQGSVSPDRVTEVLSQYDLFFMPSLSENFGHAILEALCAGCPVLISDQTPWKDINERGAGWSLPLAEPNRFRSVIQSIVDADEATLQAFIDNAYTYGSGYYVSSSKVAVEDTRRLLVETATISNGSSKDGDL